MTYYADSKAVAADLKRRGVHGVSMAADTEDKPEAPPMEMAVTMHNGRLYFQHARPSDAGLEFAKTAQEAADLLLSGQDVRMAYDLEAGRKVKQLLLNRG